MSPMSARLAVRLLLLTSAALSGRGAAAADTEPPIVVTGERFGLAGATSAGLDAARIDETVNAVSVEDMLRYLPSLLVRKRHIGDTQAPLATRTSGVGASARSLVYADGILLSALIGNNNSSASPRWGMVSPGEIARIDVLYGPFDAAYPGNSIGAVVNLTTHLPEGPEATLSLGTSIQHFSQYGSSGDFPALQAEASWGGRAGDFAWLIGANHVSSESQPLAYVTVPRPGTAGASGAPVTGAVADRNRFGSPVEVIGAGGLEDQVQDNLKLKLAWDVDRRIRLIYRGGLFLNDTGAHAETWLRGSDGRPVYAGQVAIGGRSLTIPASAFSNNFYHLDERHWMHALTLESRGGAFEWRAIASRYDFDRDVQRIPSSALPAAASGGAGAIVRLDGTGWRTLDFGGRGRLAAHELSGGAHADIFRLVSDRFATTDWLHGSEGVRTQAARGRTRTLALWLQDSWTLEPRLELIVGGRAEWWRAYDGFNFSLAPALSVDQPEGRSSAFSPKASLAFRPGAAWRIAYSAGQAWRFPTVTELYQAVANGPVIVVPNPDLRPERARSEELAIEHRFGASQVRLSLFNERIRDALISQTSPAQVSFVQNIETVRTHGLEFAFDWRNALPALDLSGSLTLADPRIVSDGALPAAEGKLIPQVPRRRATLVATWHAAPRATLTLAGRYSSRSFGTIDNSDIVAHTYQGFEGFVVLDARATFRLTEHLEAAVGGENLTNARYYLFHPFPQRSITAEISYRW